ncbi:MAG TPA: hypothetical protein H9801_09535 [Candidatus Collinsella stercoripullorum]|nr:hypothetical protein [Candidatus Collinsella stercoripullorum]
MYDHAPSPSEPRAELAAARRAAHLAVTAGLTAALVVAGGLGPWARAAYAASADTEAELAALTEQVRDAAATHSEATANAAELDRQIAEQAEEILRIEQEVIPEQRDRASRAAANLYKMRESSSNIVSMLLSASSLSDFITQTKYLTSIQDDNVQALEEYESACAELEAKLAELSAARDQAGAETQRAADALAQASSAQQALEERAASEDAAEAAAARAAADEAAALQAQMEQEAVAADGGAGQTGGSDQGSAGSGDAGSSGGSASEAPSAPSAPADDAPSSDGGSSADEGGWLSGVASHYGTGDGLMGALTASGEPVTETSMGIAMLNVPLGTMVEIRYNGRSVIARVNDRGPYAHGRVIDMQPAVARALGFLSVGVDTVEYRFL